MPEFVVTPCLEPVEDRLEAQLRIPLDLAKDRDVARVADLLGEVGRIENELGSEVLVLLGLAQETDIDNASRRAFLKIGQRRPAYGQRQRGALLAYVLQLFVDQSIQLI